MCMNCKNQVQINICPRCRHCPCICNRRQVNNCNYNSRPYSNYHPAENTTVYSNNNYYISTPCNYANNSDNINNISDCENTTSPSCNKCKCCNKCKKHCCNNKCGCNGLFWLAALAFLII